MSKPSALWFQIKLHLPVILRLGLIVLLLTALALTAVFAFRGCSFGRETITSGGKLLSGAHPTDHFLPFGDQLLCFNGQTLVCYSKSAEELWRYRAADEQAYAISASDRRIALYSGEKLILLDEKGNAVFSGRMEGRIVQVRPGQAETAVELEGSSQLQVLDRNGASLDSIDLSPARLVDFGFYSSNDLLWALTLDVSGLSPNSRLDIYKPGKELVSSYKSDTQLYYKPLFHQDDVYILGTEALDLTSGGAFSSLSVYGWQYAASTAQGGSMHIVLTLTDEGNTPTLARVYRSGSFTDLHLPAGCLSLSAGEDSLYGVSPQALYALPYGGGSIKTYAFRYTVSEVLCTFADLMVLSAADGQVYLVRLP